MILADVIVGKPKIVHVDRPFKKTAPQGYDSVSFSEFQRNLMI